MRKATLECVRMEAATENEEIYNQIPDNNRKVYRREVNGVVKRKGKKKETKKR